MMPRSWSPIAAAAVFTIVAAACKEDAPFVKGAPAGPAMGGTIERDGGSAPAKDEDAGPIDAGSPITFCTRVTGTPGGMDSAEIGTWVEAPGDLTLSRQDERWTNDCSDLRLILEFSDGVCPVGAGHSLTFAFTYRAFIEGVLHAGNNMVGADTETPAISVRYTRPAKLKPHGTWGSCDGALGQLIFLNEPVLEPGHYLQARYQLNLTPCPGTSGDMQFVEGSFNVLLRTSHLDACPGSGGTGGSSAASSL